MILEVVLKQRILKNFYKNYTISVNKISIKSESAKYR